MRAAAGPMRAILIDFARRKKAKKRSSGGKRVVLDDVLAWYEDQTIDVIELNEALDQFRGVDEQLAQLFELRMFGGLTVRETSRILGLSVRTVERSWETARAWMMNRLHD